MVGLNFLVERGTADPDRLGLYGSSYGGWLTAWAISQTGRFQGAVVALGYYDLLYRDRVSGKAFHSLTPNRLGTADPMAMWSAPEVYTHLSPMEHVAKVRTPVLLIETAAEARSQLGGGRAFCNGLWAQGVEASLVRYAEAFHQGGWTDEYKTDYANRLTAWFDHCLLGRPLPGWFLDAWAFAGI
jgi:dipeptidyl aminopeptidase/acylaminoacyl peptidase